MPRRKKQTAMKHNPKLYQEWDGAFPTRIAHGSDEDSQGKGAVVILFGPSGSGKSVMTQYLIARNHKAFCFGVGMSTVSSTLSYFRKHFPPSFVIGYHCSEVLDRIMQKTQEDLKTGFPVFPWLCVLDDTSENEAVMKNCKTMKKYARKGRHTQGHLLISVQKFTEISTTIRENAHYVIIGNVRKGKQREKLYKEWFSNDFDDKDEFSLTMDRCCANYGFMVQFGEGTGRNGEIAMVRADPKLAESKYRIGIPDMWLLDYTRRVREAKYTKSNLMLKAIGKPHMEPDPDDGVVFPDDPQGVGGALEDSVSSDDEAKDGYHTQEDAHAESHQHHHHHEGVNGGVVVCLACEREEAMRKANDQTAVEAEAMCRRRKHTERRQFQLQQHHHAKDTVMMANNLFKPFP